MAHHGTTKSGGLSFPEGQHYRAPAQARISQAEQIASRLLGDEDENRAVRSREDGPRFKPTLPRIRFLEGAGPERFDRIAGRR